MNVLLKTVDRPELKNIKLLLMDVDGVLTNGDIIYTDAGGEIKAFNVRDGLGIRLLQKAGIQVGIVTGRSSGALLHRCSDLGIELIYHGVQNKGDILEAVMAKTGLTSFEIAFVGDDAPDIALLKKVGLGIAVADAHETVKTIAHMTTQRNGGNGAVREICEWILKAKGLWEEIVHQWE
jgi:3-deoxy-D-manno-octulosonate 8-phosphate phosphatase (KDO 8-P phosphatase)